jgi:hypothetical protein
VVKTERGGVGIESNRWSPCLLCDRWDRISCRSTSLKGFFIGMFSGILQLALHVQTAQAAQPCSSGEEALRPGLASHMVVELPLTKKRKGAHSYLIKSMEI